MRAKAGALAATLGVVAAFQATVLVVRRLDDLSPEQPPSRSSGDLSRVVATDTEGRKRSLPALGPLLVLVFDPECAHTRRVAPVWSDWLRNANPSFSVVALSASRRAAASAYAAEAGWSVPVLTIRANAPEKLARDIVRRTPWVFAVDAHGRVVSAGHGSRVSEVANALWTTSQLGPTTAFHTLAMRRNHAY